MEKIKWRSICSILFFLVSSLVMTSVFAHAIKKSATSYAKLIKIVADLPSPNHTLLILDNDDTLTMMPCSDSKSPKTCQYLGEPAWFDWQTNLPKTSKDRVADSFDELLMVNGLLFSLNHMQYTETDAPMVLILY